MPSFAPARAAISAVFMALVTSTASGQRAPATAGPPTAPPATSPSAAPPAPTVPAVALSPWAYANTDPDDDLIVAPPTPLADCNERLAAAGVTFSAASIPPHRQGKLLCGADQLVTYKKGPGGIKYSSPPVLSCQMALGLARLEMVIQEEALRVFGKRVKHIHQMGTYSCREIAAYPGWVSEHSYANAIDVDIFTLEGDKKIFVSKHFSKSAEAPAGKEADFLRAISRRAYDENVLSSVLTPFFNQAHWNHFHLDQSHFRNDGTRTRE